MFNRKECISVKEKDQYTFTELCENLPIPVSEFCRRAGVTEGTLARLRQGFSARRVTVNKLLIAFSKVYGLELSSDNVTGLTLEDKREIRRQMLERKGITEHAPMPSVPSPMGKDTSPTVPSPQKRTTTKKQKQDLPAGCILAKHFAEQHNVSWGTMYDHLLLGKGPGTVPGEERNPVLPVRDHIEHEKREKRKTKNRKGEEIIEYERYLTADQQRAALEFWQRHRVAFNQCENTTCWCHTFLEESE
jgi:transcriptional regulator with XRE-family HTH domain